MPKLPHITANDWRSAARQFLSHYPINTSEENCNHVIANDGRKPIQDFGSGGQNSPACRLLFSQPNARPIISSDQ